MKKEINGKGIQGVEPGMRCYVDLRAWGWDFYESSGLPNLFGILYVVECVYVRWSAARKRRMDVRCDLFNQLFVWTAVDIDAYGRNLALTEDMVLVDYDLCQRYPKLLN